MTEIQKAENYGLLLLGFEFRMSGHFVLAVLVLFFLLASDANSDFDESNHISMPVETGKDASISIPKAIDWRRRGAVTPVKDRKGCANGSWAFAVADSIESINKIATGVLVELSAQQLLDCSGSYKTEGCHNGFPQNAFEYLVDTGNGLSTAKDYHFTGFNATCRKHNRYSVFIDDFDNLYGSSDDTKLLQQVAKQPVTAVIDGNAPEFVNYKGGIYKGPCKDDQASPFLSVLIVGYGSEDGQDYWIIKNSAGPNWGEKGYMRLQRGNSGTPLGRCGVNGFPYFPLKKKEQSPPPPPPSPPPPRPPPPPPVPCNERYSCWFITRFPCCPPNAKPRCCRFYQSCTTSGCV